MPVEAIEKTHCKIKGQYFYYYKRDTLNANRQQEAAATWQLLPRQTSFNLTFVLNLSSVLNIGIGTGITGNKFRQAMQEVVFPVLTLK